MISPCKEENKELSCLQQWTALQMQWLWHAHTQRWATQSSFKWSGCGMLRLGPELCKPSLACSHTGLNLASLHWERKVWRLSLPCPQWFWNSSLSLWPIGNQGFSDWRQWPVTKVLAALPEDPNLNASSHISWLPTTCNSISRGKLMSSSGLHRDCIYTCANTHTHIK